MLSSRKQRLYLLSSTPSQAPADMLTLSLSVSSKTDLNTRYGQGSAAAFWIASSTGAGSKEAPTVRLAVGNVLRLDQSDASNAGYTVDVYASADKTGGPLGQRYGIAGQAGAYTEVLVDSLPLYYEAVQHESMGGPVLQGGTAATESALVQLATVGAQYQWVRQPNLNHALLGPGIRLQGLDLAGSSLSGLNLTDVAFTGATLDGADFTNTTLTGASFDGTSLVGANFTGAAISTADLTGADLASAVLIQCDLSAATLRKTVEAASGDVWTGTGMQSGNRLALTVRGFPESQRKLNGLWVQVRAQDAWSQLVGRSSASESADLADLVTGPVMRFQADEDLLMFPMTGGIGALPPSAEDRWVVVTGEGAIVATGPPRNGGLTPEASSQWSAYTLEGAALPLSAAVTVELAVWLRTADLTSSDMGGSDLSSHNLVGVPIGGADLGAAKLAGARLDGADVHLDLPDPAQFLSERRLRRALRTTGWIDDAQGNAQPLTIGGTDVTGLYEWDGAVFRKSGNSALCWERLSGGSGVWALKSDGTELLRETTHTNDAQPSRTGYSGLPAAAHSFAVVGASQMLTELRGCDLSGAFVSHADLSHHDLRGVTLTGATLQDARLRGVVADSAGVWGSGEVGGVQAFGVRLPQALPDSGTVTAHLEDDSWLFEDASGAPLLAELQSGSVEDGTSYVLSAGGQLSNGAVLQSSGNPPTDLSVPGTEFQWLSNATNGTRTLVGPGVDLSGAEGSDLTGLDGLPSSALLGCRIHGIVSASTPPSAPPGYVWKQSGGGGGWTLFGDGLSYQGADLSDLDLSDLTNLSVFGVRKVSGATLPANFEFVDLSDGSKALFGPGADLRGAKLGGLTSVSEAALSGMRLNNVRMTAEEAAAWTGAGTWVEQPGLRTADGSRYALIHSGVDIQGANLRDLDTSLGDMAGLTLSGAQISISADAKATSIPPAGFSWIEVTRGDQAGTFSLLGPGMAVESDLRSAALSDMSLAGSDLSSVTLDDTRIFNITDRTDVKLPAGSYTWVDQGGGKELLTGPGLSLQGADLDNTDFTGTTLNGMNFSNASLRGVTWTNAKVRDVPAVGTAGAQLDEGFAFAEQTDGLFALVGPGVDTVGLSLSQIHPDLGTDVLSMRQNAQNDWILGFDASSFRSGGSADVTFDSSTRSSYADVTVNSEPYRFEIVLLDADGQTQVFPPPTYYASKQGVSTVLSSGAVGLDPGLSLQRGTTYRFDTFKATDGLYFASARWTSASARLDDVAVQQVGTAGTSGSFAQLATTDQSPNEIFVGGPNIATARITLPASAQAAASGGAASAQVYPLAPSEDATLKFRVQVAADGFRIQRPHSLALSAAPEELVLVRGHTYHFEQNDPSNEGNPLRFTTVDDASTYRYGYVRAGTDAEGFPGDPMGGSFLSLTVSEDPTVHPEAMHYVSDRFGPSKGSGVRLVPSALHSATVFPGDGSVLLRVALAPGTAAWSYSVDGGGQVSVASGSFALLEGLAAGNHTIQVEQQSTSVTVPDTKTGQTVAFDSPPAVNADGQLVLSASPANTTRWAYRVDERQPALVPAGQTQVKVDLAGTTPVSVVAYAVDAVDGTRLAADLATVVASA